MMIKLFSLAVALTALTALATPATYNDLGEDAGVSTAFWDTRGHTGVAVDQAWGDVPTGYDPRGGEDGVALSGEDFDVRGKTSEESGVIAFLSTMVRGLLMFFK